MYILEIYQDKRGQYRWRCRAENGKIVATSGGDGYHNLTDCEEMLAKLRAAFPLASVVYQWDTGEG